MMLLPDGTYHLAVGSTEMGNGSVTSHRQIAASVLGARAGSIDIINADTDLAPYEPAHSPVPARWSPARRWRSPPRRCATTSSNLPAATPARPRACRLEDGGVMCGERADCAGRSARGGHADGHRFEAKRKAYLSPRTVAFNVQGIRLAVHRMTGEIRILQSVHAADIGRLINPMQCRGQIDGAIAMGFGWALTENMVHDATARW